jgi:biotin carboxyl carrier protein
MKFELYSGGKKLQVEAIANGEAVEVSFEGKRFKVELTRVDSDGRIAALVDGKELGVVFDEETESVLKLTVGGRQVTLGRAQTHVQSGSSGPEVPMPAADQNALFSPLFGKVISVDVKVGDAIDSGQSLVVLEAMKMESVLRADGKHVVKEVLVKVGDGVKKGQLIMRFN